MACMYGRSSEILWLQLKALNMYEYQWTKKLAYAGYVSVSVICLDNKGVVQDLLVQACR